MFMKIKIQKQARYCSVPTVASVTRDACLRIEAISSRGDTTDGVRYFGPEYLCRCLIV